MGILADVRIRMGTGKALRDRSVSLPRFFRTEPHGCGAQKSFQSLRWGNHGSRLRKNPPVPIENSTSDLRLSL